MYQLETALKASLGNFFSGSFLAITAPEHDAVNALITGIVQLVIAIATIISLLKKRQKNGKD